MSFMLLINFNADVIKYKKMSRGLILEATIETVIFHNSAILLSALVVYTSPKLYLVIFTEHNAFIQNE